MKKAQANPMVVILIVIIIAMISISVVWGLIRSQQDTTAITDDQFTGVNETCVRITDLCYAKGSLSVENASSGDLTGNFTECGDSTSILYGASGAVGICPDCLGTVNASYTEQACGRITGFTGTLIDYIPLLMAVLILVFVAGFAIK